MFSLIGIAITFAMVFGGYLLAGGKLEIIAKSLPFEMMMIGGAAIGSFLLGNDLHTAKQTGKDIIKAVSGPKWRKEDYSDLLCLLFQLVRISKQNPVLLEEHIEAPQSSEMFKQYPKILQCAQSTGLICDTFRSATMNYSDPHQVEEIMDKQLDEALHHKLQTSHALQTMADGLPALGIVAAVLGVIKTMGSIDQPPEVLGKLIGGALVGTFLGVFLAYCIVAPLANKLREVVEDEHHFFTIIRDVLIAHLQDHTPSICVEVGRQSAPPRFRPDFASLSETLKKSKTVNL